MRIAIIADLHGNLESLDTALSWFSDNEIEAVLCCGDVDTPEALEKLAKGYAGPIHLVFGNADADRDGMKEVLGRQDHVISHGEQGRIELAGLRFAITHYPDVAEELAASNEYDFVFHGHTHKPWKQAVGRAVMANPGTLGGLRYQATFAWLDTRTGGLELVLLERLRDTKR